MKKITTYIGCFTLLFSLSFAGEKEKGSSLNGQAAINFNQTSFTEDDGATVDRKRAHKRKRRIRPRRNGF
tara:strand:+ start:1018 stop:1227 length:210 start_codon:yes stop_codon:yes gene_type:complete